MSWLVNSIANSLKLDDDNDDEYQHIRAGGGTSGVSEQPSPPHSKSDDVGHKSFSSDFQNSPRSGVREDLSELSKTLTRHLWGVASFLAPPPEITNSYRQQQSGDSDPDTSSSTRIEGIRSDLYEIGGRFRSGISKISANKTVTDFTKVASNFLQFGSEEENEYAQRGVIGVTEEVVAFARDISMHPETWLDFPLPDDNEGEQGSDFDLSDAQQEHALAVESLAPRLAALRIELCPGYMSEGCFWMIYFALVHPRLTKQDALVLSSPQIERTRALLTSEVWSRLKPEAEESSKIGIALDGNISDKKEPSSVLSSDPSQPVTINVLAVDPSMSMEADIAEVDKHPLASVEIPVIDKAIVEEISADHAKNEKSIIPECVEEEGDEGDDWLKESVEIGVKDGNDNAALQDDDISFSDLEDDDDGERPIKQ